MPPHMYTESSSSSSRTEDYYDTTKTPPTTQQGMEHSSHTEEQLRGAIEIIPNRLYYAPLKYFPTQEHYDDSSDEESGLRTSSSSYSSPGGTTRKKKEIHYFSIDSELIYWNFFLDFGPLNLGQLYRFSSKLNAKLSSPQYKDCIICYYSGAKGEQRSNASYLICAWSMLYLGRTLDEAYFGFQDFFAEGVGEEDSSLWKQPGENVSLPPPSPAVSSRSSPGGGVGKRVASPFARLHPLPPFHDASPIVCTYDLTVYDCLQGLDRAREFGFFKFGNTPPAQSSQQQRRRVKKQRRSSVGSNNSVGSSDGEGEPLQQQQWGLGTGNPTTFNPNEYEYFEQVENGDLNWIIQNKILAVAGPQNQKVITPEGFCMLTPQDYIPYFLKSNVKLVVRLNRKCYDENEFINAGIRHVEHYYLDGSCPEMSILHSVVSDMESVAPNEAIAVHCKAGLGRTGTCIGAYMMKHYRMTAKEVIGWMRVCRPGMVIGPQQHFLADIQNIMWQEGDIFRGAGLKNMIVDATDESDEKNAAASAASTLSFMSTPQSTPPGAHATIVSPDGQPVHIPATPVSRKLAMDDKQQMKEEDIVMAAAPSSQIHSTSSSSTSLPTMDALEVNSPDTSSNATDLEGAQANALLSRRIAEYKDRHQPK
jgi:cell division cycle 14